MKTLSVGLGGAWTPVVKGVFDSRGHDQLVATTGTEALASLRGPLPQLIVVEDPLTDMSAAEFCQRARRLTNVADTVILVITPRSEDLAPILDAGATDLYATTLEPAALEMRLLIAERLVSTHARLRDREIKFRRLFDAGDVGVVISDVDGNLKEANPVFLEMLGYTQEDMLAGRVDWESVTPRDSPETDVEARARFRAGGYLGLIEREYVHKDGHLVAVLFTSAALDESQESVGFVTNITERKRVEAALRASEERYRILFEQSPFPKFLYDFETLRYLAVNEAAIRHYGYSRDEFLTMIVTDLQPQEEVTHVEEAIGATSAKIAQPGLHRHQTKDGQLINVDITVYKFMLDSKPCVLAVALDVTEKNLLESQLRQAQKMEAIGRLAGGVAHDFNNLLSVILSYSKMLAAPLPVGDPLREDLEEITSAGTRAADLTRQLLAFSRQQVLEPQIVDMNNIMDGTGKMLRRLVGEDVDVIIVSGAQFGLVLMDPGQLEQILMNLAVNSRDAMPHGGKLTIETANVIVDAGHAAKHSDVEAGRYVMLTVTDTGNGMDPETIERIFEPFFTTKEIGRGTGLGLSTVFGIVHQSGGHISVSSEKGVGTTFKVYIPESVEACDAASVTPPGPSLLRGKETILLVEDEEAVRILVRNILERSGYQVITAQTGAQALLISRQNPATIHLLLTDVVMPRMSGRTLAEHLVPLRPEMNVLYMSGYTDESIVHHGLPRSGVAFLQKPITPDALTRKVREVLDSRVPRNRINDLFNTPNATRNGVLQFRGHS